MSDVGWLNLLNQHKPATLLKPIFNMNTVIHLPCYHVSTDCCISRWPHLGNRSANFDES